MGFLGGHGFPRSVFPGSGFLFVWQEKDGVKVSSGCKQVSVGSIVHPFKARIPDRIQTRGGGLDGSGILGIAGRNQLHMARLAIGVEGSTCTKMLHPSSIM